MITHDKIDLIMKVAKMCARKAGLPEQDVISMGALRHAMTIYCNLPEPGTVFVAGQGYDQLSLKYDYKTNLLNVWTEDDSDAGINLDMYQVESLIKELNKIHKGMVYIKYNNLHAELTEIGVDEEDIEPRFNCDCC